MRAKPLAIILLGTILFLLFVYFGLNVAEKGLQELMALEGETRALCFKFMAGKLQIIFAGKEYHLVYGPFLENFY